jgi:DNA-binding winged helix-turn-helix (wHTH) protein/tetratricopeptide (TPR) repeat protein
MESPVYRFGEFRLDPVKRELWRGEALVEVPARAFAGLLYLIEHRERAIGRTELIEALWHRSNVSDTQLFQLILRTRRLVGDEAERQRAIRTVAGFGYRWVAPTEVSYEAPSPEISLSEAASPAREAADVPPREPTAPAVASAPRPRRGWVLAAAIVVAIGVAGLWFSGKRAPSAPERRAAPAYADARVAVLPFRVDAGADAAWVRFGGMDLVADRLRRAGVAVQPSEATLGLVMAAPGEADGGAARLRDGSGVELLVDGQIGRAGSAWQVALRAEAPGLPPLQSTASDGDLMAALRTASDRLLVALGRAPPSGALDAALAEVLQRARAALLADDAGQARSVLEQAPASLREDPELRLLLAQIEARQGRFDAAEALLTQLLERLDGNDDAYLRMRALIARGSARLPLDRLAEAGADFDAAIAVPGAETFVHALGDAYHGRGASLTHRHEYAAAANDLGRARVLLGQSGDALAVARVDLALALLDSMRGAFAQAGPRYEQAARQFETFGAVRPLKSALIGLQDVQFDQLQNHAALASSDRAWALTSAKGDPLLQRVLSLMRARILLACGRLRELHELLARIDAGDQAYLAASRDEERLRVLRTELALREGRDADAAREAAALPTGWLPGDADDTLRAKAALWRQRALPPTPAAPGVAITPSAQSDAGSRSGAPYRRLAEAERAARLGHADEAADAYRQALALADADGVPFALAEVIQSYAGFLIGQGRLADAAAVGGRIGAWAADDFDCAVLQLRLAHALGDPTAWQSALANARRLAGERSIPPGLLLAPASGSSANPLKDMAESRRKQSGSGS